MVEQVTHSQYSALPKGLTSRPRRVKAYPLAMLALAASVAALAVAADQLIGTWADEHLLMAWLCLWGIVFLGCLLLSGTARRVQYRIAEKLDAWAHRKALERARLREQRLLKGNGALRTALESSRNNR